MAEFCKDCFKLINESYYHGEELVMSDEEDFCEGCCEMKKVVVGINKRL